MLTYVHNFLYSLVFSAVIESAVVVILFYLLQFNNDKIKSNKIPRSDLTSRFNLIVVATVGTILTIPYVWFVFPTLLWDKVNYIVTIGESFAIIIEILFYRYYAKLDWKYAFVFSLVANMASYLLGKI